jgi:hypothetical protein
VLCETWEIWYTPRSVAIYVFEHRIHAEQVQELVRELVQDHIHDYAQDHVQDCVQDHKGLKAPRTEE